MRTFDEFWNSPTPENDALRKSVLDAVARAQSEDFTTWRDFCAWDLGPGDTGMSRFLFDTVKVVLSHLYPYIAKVADSTLPGSPELASWADGGLFDKVTAERRKQIGQGHDAGHDDAHDRSELAMAAVSYALPFHRRGTGSEMLMYSNDTKPEEWPFERASWRPSPLDRKRELVKAMALLVAEYERLERTAK